MSILLLGDIHGAYGFLDRALVEAERRGVTALIQVGDFGLFPGNEQKFYQICQHDIPTYFIDGNHDDCTRWMQYDTVSKVFGNSNLYYVPRGSVLEIDGRTIAFMGGAASIDKGWRLADGIHWDENEEVTQENVNTLLKNAEGKNIDMFLTHCPPQSMIDEHFDPRNKLRFGVGLDWHDPSQTFIEEVWHKIGTPHVYSGHMHRYVEGQVATILHINQICEV
jgi:Icc-related predicted phosphoesterase